ncbi:hypothetical protein NM208_g13045 [Fusarium decemcellulare]|uniref:Uncharacterized protein n=1 Tax=Fusarium decemcellulare TaxID=57161 RepID=A0ACC1RNU4_9HYPO|nr:hypothetical protein NM208_g13045 [Fusarium decemcellulare]
MTSPVAPRAWELRLVRLLAHHGAGAIWIADWNEQDFYKIREEIAQINPLTNIYTHKVDVSDPKQVDDWVAKIITDSGALHGAANVAGLSQPAFTEKKPAILAETNDNWARVMGVNINGIIMASLLRGPSAFAYGASKAACAHFTSCVAKDVYPFGIRANTVSPGNTYTAMTKEFFGHMSREETEQQLNKLGVNTRMLEADDVARVIVWLLSEAAMDVNGVNLPIKPEIRKRVESNDHNQLTYPLLFNRDWVDTVTRKAHVTSRSSSKRHVTPSRLPSYILVHRESQMTGESFSYRPRSNEDRRPAAKRRKIRKGTTSCWECKRRKAKCHFPSPTSQVCAGCQQRETPCVTQEYEEDLTVVPEQACLVPESIEDDKTNGLEGRLERVEALLQRLLDGGVCLSTPGFGHRTADTMPPSLRIAKEDDGDIFDTISRTFPHIHRLPPTTPNNYELISRELYSALPSQRDADLIIAAGNTAPFLQFLCRPYEDLFRGKMLPASALSTFPSPKSHPVLIARSLLYLAHGIQNLHPPTFDLGQLDLGSSTAAAMQRFLDIACRLVTSNDEMMESLEGVECHVLEFAYHINAGNLRRAWLVMRRALSLAQLLGLHHGDHSDLTILEPTTMASPSFTWHRIVSQDRYLALMLGLPAGTPDDCLGNPQDLTPDDCPMGYLERIHCVIMGRITASRHEKTNDGNTVELRSIDLALENAARGMPSDWWLFPSTKRGSSSQDEDLEEVLRILFHITHFSLLIYLRLPHMLRGAEEATHDSSKSACVNASRELLRRYIRFRCMDSIAFCCTSIDFSAFTACLTLLLAHLRRWHHNPGVTDGIAHQRLSDRDMVHETVELMHELSQECGDTVLEKTAEIVTSLARIEADAAKQSGLYGDYGSTNHRRTPNRSLRLMVPSFGVVSITRDGVFPSMSSASETSHRSQKRSTVDKQCWQLSGPLVDHGQESATEVPFFSFGGGNANGPHEMQAQPYLDSLGALEEHALWNDEGPNAQLEPWEFCGTNSRNLSFSLDAGSGEWAHQTDMPGPDCSDEQDELFSSFLNNLAT